jgi:hypothetical protein
MIPILQFDPATLTLWYDTQLLASSRTGREVGLALHYATDGREDWLQCLVRQQRDPWVRTRCATVASAVWHEKRHFLDFVLTNYGAMRVRQFFQCYINTRIFLSKVDQNGPVLMPLDRNLNSGRSRAMGVSLTDPDLKRIAEWISESKSALLEDRRPFIYRGVPWETGGEAMLEAIAYHVQIGKVHRVFGAEVSAGIQRDNLEQETVANKYKWAYVMFARKGLIKYDYAEGHGGTHQLTINDGPLIPILYAALAGRYYRQEQTRTAYASSALPPERLISLIAYFDEHKIDLTELSTLQAWEAANDACKQTFGRSVIDEIEADYEKEAERIALYREADIDDFVTSAYEDFHRLRGQFIQVLKDDPAAVLDQGHWSDRFVNKTRPFIIAAAPAGVIGIPPNGFERLSGVAPENVDFAEAPDYRWWWTAIRTEGDVDNDENTYRLGRRNVWGHIIADFAPVAKLMIDGNRMRSMVGPELVSTKARIERQTGVKLIVDSLSRYPEESLDIAEWYFLTGNTHFRCQVTHEIVPAPHGKIIGPWEFRRRPAFLEALLGTLSGSQRERMRQAYRRDWSPWLVSDEVYALFKSAKLTHAEVG